MENKIIEIHFDYDEDYIIENKEGQISLSYPPRKIIANVSVEKTEKPILNRKRISFFSKNNEGLLVIFKLSQEDIHNIYIFHHRVNYNKSHNLTKEIDNKISLNPFFNYWLSTLELEKITELEFRKKLEKIKNNPNVSFYITINHIEKIKVEYDIIYKDLYIKNELIARVAQSISILLEKIIKSLYEAFKREE